MTVGNRNGYWGKLIPIFGVSGFFLASLISLILMGQAARAVSSPAVINYQGKLLIDSHPATTTQNMTFVLYDSVSGGTALYTASGTIGSPAAISVLPNIGLFSIDLGSSGTNALDTEIFNTTNTVYVEVRVGAQTLSPRKRITAVPYSYTADFLRGILPSTNTNTTYIPISDASGNFNFNLVTSTGIYSSGNVTASTSVRSRLYCDVNGNNCFDPAAGWPGLVSQIATSTALYTGYITSTGLQGYLAANDICNSTVLVGSHFCQTNEIIDYIRSRDVTWFGTGAIDGSWIANGPPGFTSNSNDCNGWISSLDTRYGSFWILDNNGGGAGWLAPCNVSKPITCCK